MSCLWSQFSHLDLTVLGVEVARLVVVDLGLRLFFSVASAAFILRLFGAGGSGSLLGSSPELFSSFEAGESVVVSVGRTGAKG